MNESEVTQMVETVKYIRSDIDWQRDRDHSLGWEFRIDCDYDGQTLRVIGSCCKIAEVASFVIVHQQSGRVYALDLGKCHVNADGTNVGDVHKHKPRDCDRTFAYKPDDITASATDLTLLWKQFCLECNIVHEGRFRVPDEYLYNGDLFDGSM